MQEPIEVGLLLRGHERQVELVHDLEELPDERLGRKIHGLVCSLSTRLR